MPYKVYRISNVSSRAGGRISMEFVSRLNRFRFFRHHHTDPSPFFKSIVATPNRVAGVMGLDVFTEGYKTFSWRLGCAFVVVVVFLYTSFFTAIEVHNSQEDLIFCLITLGIGIQGSGKIYTYMRYKRELASIFQYVETLYREKFNHRDKKLIMDAIFLTRVIVKVMLVTYAFVTISMLIAPIPYALTTGEKILPFGFYLPYLDRHTWSGYAGNYVLYIITGIYASSEDMGPDCIYIITLMSAFTQIDLLISALSDLNQMIEANDANINDAFGRLIVRYQEHMNYLRTVETVYRFNFFITFCSLSLVLIMTFYSVVTLSWYQGWIFIIFMSYELFFCSFFGTLLEIKNEQLQREIYNITWYKLSISDQKSLRFLLQSAQEPVCLTLIFAPLNMPTFLQVYKTIYSIFTMLLTVGEE